MSSPFTNSFTANSVSRSENNKSDRPSFTVNRNIDEVIQHFVSQSVMVSSASHQTSKGEAIPLPGVMDANMRKVMNDRRDIKNILSMNPNAQLAIDIVVNGTLSPNNTLDTGLQYKSSYDKFGPLKAKFLTKIKDVMDTYVEMDDILPSIVREAKYEVGSYALLVIPMRSVKRLIQEEQARKDKNAVKLKLESFTNAIVDGVSGKSTNKLWTNKIEAKYFKPKNISIKLEDLGIKDKDFADGKLPKSSVLIHSDPSVIYAALFKNQQQYNEEAFETLDSLANESTYIPEEESEGITMESLSQDIINDSIRTSKNYKMDELVKIRPEFDAEASDLPLVTRVPHEAIYVSHRPGSPEVHQGYFLAMDMAGHFVSIEEELDTYMPNYQGVFGNSSSNSAMAANANFAAGNMELGTSQLNSVNRTGLLSEKTALYSKLMDEQFKDLFKDGHFHGKDITIARKSELMEVLFTRLCANKQTQLVYVPASLLTYFAFDYDENGNGLSMVIKHRNIGVLNSILTLSNTVAAVNNAIDYKKIRVAFDEDEIDFNKVVEGVASNLARYTTLNSARLMNTDVNSQIDFLGHAGYQWEFEDHPQFPGTSVTIEHLDRDRTEPDADTVEKNEAKLIQSLGSTPEVVDMARGVEYAASYFQSNLQAARRAIADQKILTRHSDRFVKSFVLNAPILLKWMIKEIDNVRSDYPELSSQKTVDVVRDFVSSIETSLPKPDMVKIELLDKAIQAQEGLVDKVLEYTIGEEALDGADVGDNLEETLDKLRRKLKSLIMREWMSSNSMMNDNFLVGLFAGDQEEVDNTMERIETQQQFIIDTLKKHKIIIDKQVKEADDDIEKIQNAQDLDGSGGGNSGFESNNDSSSDDSNTESTDDDSGDGGEEGGGDGEVSDPFAPNNGSDDIF